MKSLADENNLGGKVSLDVTDFKANIAILNREIKVIESGFRATAAGIGDWGSSIDGLQARISSLNGVIDAQARKVDNLKEIYKKIVAEKGEDSKAAQELLIKINNETAALNKNKLELDRTTKALNDFGNQTKDADGKTGSFINSLKTIGGGIAKGAAVGIAAIGAAAVSTAAGAFKLAEMASDLSESQNVVKETFKNSGDEILKWSGTISQSAGISQANATAFVGSMGAMLKSSGLSEQAAGNMSKSLVQLTGDMSSFYNLSHEDAWEKIRAGVSGETEPLKQLGINMSVANLEAYAMAQGINKAYSEMSQAEQTTLRYNYLLSTTKDAQGDFGRTLETSFSNQLRVAKMNLESLGTEMGQKFLPSFLGVVQAINQGFKTGDWGSVGQTIANQITNLLNQITAQFPALLTLAQSLITGLANGIAIALPKILPQLIKTVLELLNMLIKILQQNGPVLIKAGMDALVTLVKGILEAIPKLIPVAITLILALVDAILDALPKLIPAAIQAIVTIANGLIDALPHLIAAIPKIVQTIVTVLVENLPLLIDAAIQIIMALVTALIQNLPLLINASIQIITALAAGIIKLIPQLLYVAPKILMALIDAFKTIDWSQLGIDVINGIINGLNYMTKNLLSSIGNIATSAVSKMKSILGIASPSKVFKNEVGIPIGKGVAEGIKTSSKEVTSESEKMAKDAIDAAKKSFNNSIQWIDEKKYYNQLSLNEELAAWKRVQTRYIEGTEERKKADREVYRVQNEINKVSEEYQSKVLKVQEETNKKRKELEDDYYAKTKEITDKLKVDIASVTDEYNKAVENRTNALYNFSGLFDEVKLPEEKITGDQLVKNLKDQVNQFDDWQSNIAELANKGINEGLIKELQDMGPKSVAQIKALNQLSGSELNNYVSLWEQKHQLAKTQALQELESLRLETENKITQLNQDAVIKLDEYRSVWSSQMMNLTRESSQQLETLKNEFNIKIGTLKNETENQFINMIDNIVKTISEPNWSELGSNVIGEITTGVKSSAVQLANEVASAARKALDAAKKALGISSPSQVFRDEVGLQIGAGMAAGLKDSATIVNKAMNGLNNQMVSNGPINLQNTGNKSSGSIVTLNIINKGTLVGSNGMNEFADTISKNISGKFGLSLGGAF